MGKQIRIEYPGAFYHVMAHGNGFQWIYKTKANLKHFKTILGETVKKYKARIHAVVLMRNHLLIETPEANLSQCMRKINHDFARMFNRKGKRLGTVFKGRYKSILVEKEKYYLTLLKYISQNPMRIGIVKRCEEYKGGFLNWIKEDKETLNYIRTEEIQEYFGKDESWQDRFIEWVNEGLEDNPQEESEYRYFLGEDRRMKAMRKRVSGAITPRMRERKKYAELRINEKRMEKILEEETERDRINIGMKIWAENSSLSIEELRQKYNMKSHAACWQRLYRFRKELKEDKGKRDRVKAIEEEALKC